jgi:hypothetical protein
MADEKQESPKRRGSCLGKLVSLFTFAGVAGLGVAVWFIFQPQDMSDIKGTSPALSGAKARDLRAVLKNAVNQNFPLSLTEEEINFYIKQSLAAKQGGLLEKFVTLDDVRVRLEKGRAEIIVVRSVMGRHLTISMYFRVEQVVGIDDREVTNIIRDGGTYFPQMPDSPIAQRLLKGGRFGQLVVPQGFSHLVLPSFAKLADVYKTELSSAFEEMARITIEDGTLVLDPRPDGGSALPGPSGTF